MNQLSIVCAPPIFLAGFTDITPLPHLRTAASIAQVLGAVHQAVSYHSIVYTIELAAGPDLAAGLTFFWREVLRTVRLLDETPQTGPDSAE